MPASVPSHWSLVHSKVGDWCGESPNSHMVLLFAAVLGTLPTNPEDLLPPVRADVLKRVGEGRGGGGRGHWMIGWSRVGGWRNWMIVVSRADGLRKEYKMSRHGFSR